jgi:hypothetical protein
MTYELLYNLVLETTRLTVELRALEMRVESAATRLDFAERRARAAEGRAQPQPEQSQPASQTRSRGGQAKPAPIQAAQSQAGPPGSAGQPQAGRDGDQAGGGDARRRKRRRRGRRGGAVRPAGEAVPGGAADSGDADPDAALPVAGDQPGDTDRSAETGGSHNEPEARETESPPPTGREDQ